MSAKYIITILIGLVAGLSVAEVGLRIVEKVQLGDRAKATTVDDPQLGMRVVPNATGHDANGFRNASVPPKVDIVALGDSQTWGINVSKDDAWPQQLGKLSGRSVYNMGVGGYGRLPAGSRSILPQLRAIRMRLVTEYWRPPLTTRLRIDLFQATWHGAIKLPRQAGSDSK